jgi:hypothetical protein
MHNVPVANAAEIRLSISKEEEMSSEQGFRGIPGIPDGWELVRIVDRPQIGEYALDRVNHPVMVMEPDAWDLGVIVRKIETPKRYRQFKNGEEYSPHFDRIVIYKSQDKGDCFYRPSCFSNERVWLGPNHVGKQWGDAFIELRFKDDGTPFGVEVTE